MGDRATPETCEVCGRAPHRYSVVMRIWATMPDATARQEAVKNLCGAGDKGDPRANVACLRLGYARERTARQAAETALSRLLERPSAQALAAAEAKLRTAEEALEALRGFLLPLAEQPGYGFGGVVDNPHDFSPDPDCCTPAEIAAHKAACEAWDAGDPVAKDRGCQSLVDEKGAAVGFSCGGSWGMGSYVYRDPEAAAHLVRTDAALAALRSQAGAGANNSPGLARQEEAHEAERGTDRALPELRDAGRGAQERAEGGDRDGSQRGRRNDRSGGVQPVGPVLQSPRVDGRPGGNDAGAGLLELAAADLTSAQPSGVAPAAPDTGRSANAEEWTARAGDPCMVEGCTEKIAVACLPSKFKACERHFADHERDCRHCGPAQREEGS